MEQSAVNSKQAGTMPAAARIYVPGHTGLVGSAIMRNLAANGYDGVITRELDELDLRSSEDTRRFFEQEQPEYVIVCAAKVGGILANSTYPAEFIYDNLTISANVIHEAWRAGARRLIYLGSSCIYPRGCPQPMKEEHLRSGPLEPKSAVFMWRPNADDMQLMFADVPDLCGIVSAGAFPRGARLLSMTLKLNDEKTHPAFSAGDYPVRGEGERAPRDLKRATFMELDGGCQPRLRTQAQSGEVRLSGDAVSKDTSAHGEIDLTFPEGSLKGSFEASFCPPPEMEPRGCK